MKIIALCSIIRWSRGKKEKAKEKKNQIKETKNKPQKTPKTPNNHNILTGKI